MEVQQREKCDFETHSSMVSQAAFNGSSEFLQCHLSTFVKVQLVGHEILCKCIFQCFERVDVQSLFDLKHILDMES